MRLDAELVFAFCCVFIRCSAMLLAAPLWGNSVPVQLRILLSAVIALGLTPVIQPNLGPAPDNMGDLLVIVLREALTGILIGGCLQLVTAAAEMAGGMLDLQMGLASAALFSPLMGSAATPLARLKFMLAVVLLFTSNAHHLMIGGFVRSYELTGVSMANLEEIHIHLVTMLGQMMLLALQISAPVAAVSILIDLAAGFINKAVPQTQPFLLALPAKIAMGLLALSLGLPAMVGAVRMGVDQVFESAFKALGSG